MNGTFGSSCSDHPHPHPLPPYPPPNYYPPSLWPRYCCNSLMDELSSSVGQQSLSPSGLNRTTADLSFYAQSAQSSLYMPSFYHQQSRFTLSSSTMSPYHSYLTGCYQSSTTDVLGLRPLSTLPSITDPRPPYWYQPTLDTCTGYYGNSFYRCFPSPSQASLPPISPSSDHNLYPRTASLPSPYTSFTKTSGSLDALGSPQPNLAGLGKAQVDTSNGLLSVKVKTEPVLPASLGSPAAKCATPGLTYTASAGRLERQQIKTESILSPRIPEDYLSTNRFPSQTHLKPEEAQHAGVLEQTIASNQLNQMKTQSNVKSDEKMASIRTPSVEPISNVAKDLYLSGAKTCSNDSDLSCQKTISSANIHNISETEATVNCAMARPNTLLEEVKYHSQGAGLIKGSLKRKETRDAVTKEHKDAKKESFKKLTQSSPQKLNAKSRSKPTNGTPLSKIHASTAQVELASHRQHSAAEKCTQQQQQQLLRPTISVDAHSNSFCSAANPPAQSSFSQRSANLTLARDTFTGQLYLISSSSGLSGISPTPPSSESVTPVRAPANSISSVAATSEENGFEIDPQKQVSEQAIQACLSDEEYDNTSQSSVIRVTSSTQVDMDAEDETAKYSLLSSNTSRHAAEKGFEKSESYLTSPLQQTTQSSSFIQTVILPSKALDVYPSSTFKEQANPEKAGSPKDLSDGLALLSALAEQRSFEERRRYSTDCVFENVTDNTDTHYTQSGVPASKRKRSESCISAISCQDSGVTDASHGESSSQKKKRKYYASDPWMIRRSERIFLNEAMHQSQSATPKDATSNKCKQVTTMQKLKCKRKSKDAEEQNENEKSDEIIGDDDGNDALEVLSDSWEDLKLDLDSMGPTQRVIIPSEDGLYAGILTAIEPPDIYGITLDGERTPNKHVYCREEILKDGFKEVAPLSARNLKEGTRVCAYWSQQYRCLYPGKIARCTSPNLLPERNLVYVEFDDGDRGRIPVTDVRMLPRSYMPNEKESRSVKAADETPVKVSSQDSVPETTSTVSSPNSEKSIEVKAGSQDSDSFTSKGKKKKKHSKDEKRHHHHRKHHHCKHHKKKKKHKKGSLEESPSSTCFDEMSKSCSNETTDNSLSSAPKSEKSPKKKEKSPSNEKSKIARFLPLKQLWSWSGTFFRKTSAKGKARKVFYKEICRGKEVIQVGDSAVFLSTGRPHLPYVGKIDSMWQSYGNMVVRVKWFYHPEETKNAPDLVDVQGALFESTHYDDNDVQTISHKCEVLTWEDYESRKRTQSAIADDDQPNVYYLGGTYEPLAGKLELAPNVPTIKPVTV